jgi:tetratricopeptide (TPR) repeat protein
MRLAGALGRFCWMRGHLHEGRRWLDNALRRDHGSPRVRAKALVARGVLAFGQGDHEQAAQSLEAGLAIFSALPDEPQVIRALSYLGMVRLSQRRADQARACLTEGLALGRVRGDGWGMALALRTLASVARSEGDFGQAEMLLNESLELYRASGDTLSTAITLMALAEAAAGLGSQERALPLLAESLTLARSLAGNRRVGSGPPSSSSTSRHERAIRCESPGCWRPPMPCDTPPRCRV